MGNNTMNLKEIYDKLGNIHVNIDLTYLEKILKQASISDKPHRNIEFLNKLNMKINYKTKSCPVMINWVRGNRTIPLEKLIKISEIGEIPWKKIEKKIISINSGTRKEGKIKFPLKIRLNKDLGLIVGHILGDGSIDKKLNQVFFSNSNIELLREFENCVKQIFNIKPRIWMQNTSNFEGKTRWEKRLKSIEDLENGKNVGLFYSTTMGRILNAIFDNFAIGTNKKITPRIMNTPNDFKKGFIRAFYDDEGSIMKGSRSIRLFQDKKDILESFRILLNEFEIIPGEIKTYIKRDKERYYFDIHRKSNFIKFKKEINFSSSKKRNRLNKLCIIKNQKNSK